MDSAREEGKLLTAAEAAEILGTTVGTLACWRCTKAYDLPFIKIGSLVRYRLNDLRDWVARRAVNLPAEPKRPRRVPVQRQARARRRAA
jgi:excisionase family DNA binding protein